MNQKKSLVKTLDDLPVRFSQNDAYEDKHNTSKNNSLFIDFEFKETCFCLGSSFKKAISKKYGMTNLQSKKYISAKSYVCLEEYLLLNKS